MKILCVDYSDSQYTDAKMRNLSRFRGLKLFRGEKLHERFPSNAVIEIRTKRPPTDFFRAGSFWIISEKLRQILESKNVEAEYFSVRLEDRIGNWIDGTWWCFNPILVLNWFDWSRSEFVFEQNFATEIKTVRVKYEVLDGVPLAVAERTIPVLVAVNDELAATINQSGCIGVLFVEPHEWKNPVDPLLRDNKTE